MTEQQILDKTIEYLNKYSNCFKNWHFDFYHGEKNIWCTYYAVLMSCSIKDALIQDFLRPSDSAYNSAYNCKILYSSEFRIAYNIIKDLSQHGTDNQINALG